MYMDHSRYAIMQKCWQENPNNRPTFSAIIVLLNEILHPRPKHPSVRQEDDEEDDEGEEHNYLNVYANVQPQVDWVVFSIIVIY